MPLYRRTIHLTPRERAAIGLVLACALGIGATVFLASGTGLLASSKKNQEIAQSPPTATLPAVATATWPATWTPAPTFMPTRKATKTSQSAFTDPPEACYVEMPVNPGKMRYSLDCEVTALWYLVQSYPSYRGLVERDALYNAVVYDENPDKGFRGDMHGPRPGNSDWNYGLHARALIDVGRRAGIPLEIIRSVHELKGRLCQGTPVIAWMRSSQGRQAPVLVRSYQDGNGVPYYTVAYEHAVLVTGYDRETVRYHDPGNSKPHTMTWQQFEQEIRLFGKQMAAAQAAPSH
jgi:uncharacterized protein YvpB